MKILSDKKRYPNPSIMASVWSPPYYMKDMERVSLKPEYEQLYYYYIKNITQLIHDKYGLVVERVSPVNEPENIFAVWDHCKKYVHIYSHKIPQNDYLNLMVHLYEFFFR